MLILQDIAYAHPNKELLFNHINLFVGPSQKLSLIGANGAGKSTILKLIAGALTPTSGQIRYDALPYYVPQHFGQYDSLTVADALNVARKYAALQSILKGTGTEPDFTTLDDDWTIEERCQQALEEWKLGNISLSHQMSNLSGGQKTKVFLAGITIHRPELILMDEPSNHLDEPSRTKLYELIEGFKHAALMVSHDRALLDLTNSTAELTRKGITLYGGNYSFFAEQKQVEQAALAQDIHSQERALKQAKTQAREAMERQQKRDARGRGQQEKSGVARIMLKTLKDQAEQSTARTQSAHAEKTNQISQNLRELRDNRDAMDQLQIRFDAVKLPAGKVVFEAEALNFAYDNNNLWHENLHFKINGGERIAIKGANGSGKTTLVQLMLGKINPTAGILKRAVNLPVYIDQDYAMIDERLTVYEQAQQHNQTGLEEHTVRTRLHQCLFDHEAWDKPCSALSGGERMRLALCCLTLEQQAPDLIILDEPTNNLDMAATAILTAAITNYDGTLLVISHDRHFLEEISIKREITLG
ncbi:ATPase subunit of ABC transporter with duplicated ATPase domains [Mucilaginibacter yixingensis]|uniref:ATPase subunit of ABC transporter with duplicated ATPase domains n=1 Tax=Mucilaginibacter yixingensis TaxID=1295612 RepID=A0A2T5JBM9_9SPHI|nr:ABC-F family ATP-binding cassette domain-containing protein [Mucilaginibacter yixingensis]PTQ98264.1 ATPase subunit of ABC transporter with duplicated ATPase domains [Mucilaginibacter yixingensis]